MQSKYSDIIALPYYGSLSRPHMSLGNRAAQFAPFAALTGYDAAIEETERLTENCTQLDEDEKAALDGKLRLLLAFSDEQPSVKITYFKPDEQKDGGAYVTASGKIKRLNLYQKQIILIDRTEIPIERICRIESDLFAAEYSPDERIV